MREMGLDVDGKPLVEPTSASTKEQDQVADAGIKTEDVADARTSAEDQDRSADPMDVDEDNEDLEALKVSERFRTSSVCVPDELNRGPIRRSGQRAPNRTRARPLGPC